MASSTLMDQTLIGSINMDDLMNTIYSSSPSPSSVSAKGPPDMTLEDFLTEAGAVSPDDVDMGEVVYAPRFIGKRRRGPVALDETVFDKVTLQRQRRMIKNRESAARSRERKQAYTAELEELVMQLEIENARLVREEAERTRKRFKKLMENLIPVGEAERPPMRAHRRVHSVGW